MLRRLGHRQGVQDFIAKPPESAKPAHVGPELVEHLYSFTYFSDLSYLLFSEAKILLSREIAEKVFSLYQAVIMELSQQPHLFKSWLEKHLGEPLNVLVQQAATPMKDIAKHFLSIEAMQGENLGELLKDKDIGPLFKKSITQNTDVYKKLFSARITRAENLMIDNQLYIGTRLELALRSAFYNVMYAMIMYHTQLFIVIHNPRVTTV